MQTLRVTESPIKGVNFQEAPLDMSPPEEIVLGHIRKLCYEHWGEEDSSYLFFECRLAQAMWANQKIPWQEVALDEAFWTSITHDTHRREFERRRILAVLCEIWLQLNEHVFEGRTALTNRMLRAVERLVACWFRKDKFCGFFGFLGGGVLETKIIHR